MSNLPVDSLARPRLAPGVRLQTDAVTGQRILLFPEGMLRLNATGVAILELCDGRPLDQIISDLSTRFNANPQRMHDDVLGYLTELVRRGYVQWEHAPA